MSRLASRSVATLLLVLGTACSGSPEQPDTVGSGGTAPDLTISNTTTGVDVLPAPESSSAPSDVDAGKFVQTLRGLPPWQTMRLPVVPFTTYIVSSVGLAVGRVDGLGDVAQTSLTGADIGQPGLEGCSHTARCPASCGSGSRPVGSGRRTSKDRRCSDYDLDRRIASRLGRSSSDDHWRTSRHVASWGGGCCSLY